MPYSLTSREAATSVQVGVLTREGKPHLTRLDADVDIACPSGVAFVDIGLRLKRMKLVGCHLHDGLAGALHRACLMLLSFAHLPAARIDVLLVVPAVPLQWLHA